MKGRNKKTRPHKASVRREGGGGTGGEEGGYAAVSQQQKMPFMWIQFSLRKQKESAVMWRRPLPRRTGAHYSSFFKLLGRQLAASASEEDGVREHINYCCILQLR